MKVSTYLSEDKISIEKNIKNREQLLKRLAEILCDAGLNQDVEELVDQLMERERLGSTSIGCGIALPHVYLDVDDLQVAMVRTHNGVDFEAMDDEPCRIFFLIIGKKDNTEPYIALLSQISRMLKRQSARDGILQAQSPAEILEAIRATEGV